MSANQRCYVCIFCPEMFTSYLFTVLKAWSHQPYILPRNVYILLFKDTKTVNTTLVVQETVQYGYPCVLKYHRKKRLWVSIYRHRICKTQVTFIHTTATVELLSIRSRTTTERCSRKTVKEALHFRSGNVHNFSWSVDLYFGTVFICSTKSLNIRSS